MTSELDRLYAAVLGSNDLSHSDKEELNKLSHGEDNLELPSEYIEEAEDAQQSRGMEFSGDLFSLIKGLSMPQKIKLALFGNQTARQILIRDSNRQVQLFVLENPRITENEVLDCSRSTSVDDLVLRRIAGSQEWMKSYQMKINIVSNPRVPVDVSIKWVKFLQEKDIRKLAKSKNIPQVIVSQCRKLLEQKQNDRS